MLAEQAAHHYLLPCESCASVCASASPWTCDEIAVRSHIHLLEPLVPAIDHDGSPGQAAGDKQPIVLEALISCNCEGIRLLARVCESARKVNAKGSAAPQSLTESGRVLATVSIHTTCMSTHTKRRSYNVQRLLRRKFVQPEHRHLQVSKLIIAALAPYATWWPICMKLHAAASACASNRARERLTF